MYGDEYLRLRARREKSANGMGKKSWTKQVRYKGGLEENVNEENSKGKNKYENDEADGKEDEESM